MWDQESLMTSSLLWWDHELLAGYIASRAWHILLYGLSQAGTLGTWEFMNQNILTALLDLLCMIVRYC